MATATAEHVVGSATGLDLETLEMVLASIDDFAERHLDDDTLLHLDEIDECPEDIVRAMCGEELGVQLVFVEEKYGGMGGSTWDVYRVCEKMAMIDIGISTTVLATFLGSDPILVGATEEQKAKWLGKIAEEGIIFAYGATEPEAGSDLGALKTTAVPIEKDGEVVAYKINGRKQWISNGSIADGYTILASTEAGPTWFILGKEAAGFTKAKPEDKHGIRLSNTAALFLDDVEVPVEELVGGVEGQGLIQAQQVFGYTRLMVAAFGLGGGWAALDRAIPYSVERIQGGSPLSEKQGYTHKLIIPHVTRLEAARAYLEETATRIDAGEGALNTEGAIAKYMATEGGNDAAEAAIQAHGGYGYTREYMVEKIKRDVKITTIYEGTSEIMEMTIARDKWQDHLKTRGQHYHTVAQSSEQLHASNPNVGADVAALGMHALAEVMEACRNQRLTRNQHVLLRIGEYIAYMESAASLCRRAAAAASNTLPEKTSRRFDAQGLAPIARVFAREAAYKVASEGLRLVRGAGDPNLDVRQLEAAVRLPEIESAQAGLLADMDLVADVVYGRVG